MVEGGLKYTPCGHYIVYPLGSIVVLRSLSSGKHAFLDAESRNNVSCVAVSRNGRYIASGQESQGTTKADVIIWDLEKAINNSISGNPSEGGCLVHRLAQHHGKVQAVDFSFDTEYLVTLGGQDDNNIVVWNIIDGTAICGNPASKDTTRCVRWLNKRNDRFVTCGDVHLKVWQVCTKTPKLHAVDASMGSMQRIMQCISISDDDSFAFVGSKTGEVLKFRIDRDNIKSFNEPDSTRPALQDYNRERFSKGVRSISCVINPETGNTNIIAGAGDGTLQIINPNLKLSKTHVASLSGAITSISLAPDGKSFYAGTDHSQRYHITLGKFKPNLCGTCHFGEIHDIIFPTKSSEIFITASIQDIRVWNSTLRQELLRIRVPNLTCYAVQLTPSGSSIISAWSDGKIRAFYPETGKLKFTIPDAHVDGVTALATCNDNDLGQSWRLVSGGKDGRVRVWKITLSHQTMIHSMKEHRGKVNSVVCNSGGTRAVSGAADGSFIVWDLSKGVRLNAMFEPTVFQHVLYHPDESQYLTCGSNQKISYWDAYDGAAIRVVEGGAAEMTCLDIQPEGDLFVSGSADKLVKLWSTKIANNKKSHASDNIIPFIACLACS